MIRQRYASSLKRHRLGVIKEVGDKEPQEETNLNNNVSVDDLTEVVIENKATVEKEKQKTIQNSSGSLEMQSPGKNTRSLERNAANRLEVSCMYKLGGFVTCIPCHTGKQ